MLFASKFLYKRRALGSNNCLIKAFKVLLGQIEIEQCLINLKSVKNNRATLDAEIYFEINNNNLLNAPETTNNRH